VFDNFHVPAGKRVMTCEELIVMRRQLRLSSTINSNPSAEGERIANLLRHYTYNVHVPDRLHLAQCVWEDWNAILITCRTIRPLLPPWSNFVFCLETLTARYMAATEDLDLGPISMLIAPPGGPRFGIQALNKLTQAMQAVQFNQFSQLDPLDPFSQFHQATQAAQFNQLSQVDQVNQFNNASQATEATEAGQISQLVSQANINSSLDPDETEAESE
jgi:hypothetical protein